MCKYPRCNKSNDYEPFSRKDHLRDHLRDIHKEDLISDSNVKKRQIGKKSRKEKAELVYEAWWAERKVSTRWWRCIKCLSTVYVETNRWECPGCGAECNEERIIWREKVKREQANSN